MVTLAQLWLPIVLSAVIVFIASSIIHMVLPFHKADYKKLSNEDAVRDAIRKGSPGPGMYMIPHCTSGKDARSEAFMKKMQEGPVGGLVLRKNGPFSMGSLLGQWFALCLVISIICACLGSYVLPAGTVYLMVFRVIGIAGFLGYAGTTAQNAIWKGEPWSNTSRHIIDGLIYGMLTAGTFGWLWPK